MSEPNTDLKVIHIYEHDRRVFENELNEALRRIVQSEGQVDDIQYAIDSSTPQNARGGFGALVVYELPSGRDLVK